MQSSSPTYMQISQASRQTMPRYVVIESTSNCVISINEVGGDPACFGIAPEDFHRYCSDTQQSHPRTMLASSTHDTKRSEDVRCRISLLSEMPDDWKAAVERWATINAKHKNGP